MRFQHIQIGRRQQPKNECGAVKDAEKVVDSRIKDLQSKRERKENNRWNVEKLASTRRITDQERPVANRGSTSNCNASADNRDSKSLAKGRPQVLLRKAPLSNMRLAVVKTPPSCRAEVLVTMLPPLPPMSTHDVRVDTVSRRRRSAICRKKPNVVSLSAGSEIPGGANISEMMTFKWWNGAKGRVGEKDFIWSKAIQMATARSSSLSKEENRHRRKAPPPMWTCPILRSKELEVVKEENERRKSESVATGRTGADETIEGKKQYERW